MTADMDNTEKVVGPWMSAGEWGRKILPPDINPACTISTLTTMARSSHGIGAIKGVGEGPIEAIIEARNNGGYFRELFDPAREPILKKLNRRVLKN